MIYTQTKYDIHKQNMGLSILSCPSDSVHVSFVGVFMLTRAYVIEEICK